MGAFGLRLKKSRFIDLGAIALILVSLGSATVNSWFEPLDFDVVKESDRQPSSIPPEKTVSELTKSMDFPCSDGAKVKTGARQIKFVSLNPCGLKNVKSIAVENLTNGYSATVFETKKSHFTTDLINLKKGDNQVQIEFHLTDGTIAKKTISYSLN